MRNVTRSIILAALGILAVGGTAGATEIYRWVDENGEVHYGDVPERANAEELAIESKRTDPEQVRATMENVAALQESHTERAAAREQAEQEREEARAEREKREQQCAEARERLRKATESRRIYKLDESGERDYYDDAEIDAVRADAQAMVEERCAP